METKSRNVLQIICNPMNGGTKFMRILMVFSSSELGGAERSLTRMALASPNSVYQLATLDGEGPWCDWVRSQGQKPLVFGMRNQALHGSLRLSAFVSLLRYVRSEGIQIVYICGLRASLWLRLFKPLMPGVKLVHGIRWNPGSNSRLDRFFRVVERWLNGLVDLYITNSQIAATTLVERCGVSSEKIRVIHNGLAEIPIKIPPLAKRPLNVLTVANLNPRKGYFEYLLVIKGVHKVIPDARFIFVGRDDMNEEIQKAVLVAGMAGFVSCEGFQSDVSHYFENARVCVLPSLWGEGCPTSILESMAWGVPVIAYRIDGIPELIRDKVDGFVVNPQNIKKMTARIIELLSSDQVGTSFGNAGREKVAKDFTMEACSTLHEQEFKKIMEIL
jgi:glycosyltransferase involved in cell wall biosynthesis